MEKKFKIGSSSIALGDVLCLTPLCFAGKAEVNLIPFHSPRLASLFDGIADIKFSEEVSPCYNTNDKTHLAQRILNYYHVSEVNCIPKILIFEKEKEVAADILSKYKNPIIFNNYSLPIRDSEKWIRHRRLPTALENSILSLLVEQGYDILRFRWKPDIADSQINLITGLNLRIQAACYFLINKYIGVDSGDYYLMLAAGGNATILINEDNPSICYRHHDWLFTEDLWKTEKMRVKYVRFQDFEKCQINLV